MTSFGYAMMTEQSPRTAPWPSAAASLRAIAPTSSPAASTTCGRTRGRSAPARSRNWPVPDGFRSTPARATINPTQFGAFLEEINHSADGGLYAELIRNRDLKESSTTPVAWSAIGAPGAGISLDSSDPLTAVNPVSLKLTIPAGTPGSGRVGVANAGYWGCR